MMFRKTIISIAVFALTSLCSLSIAQQEPTTQEQSLKPEQEAQKAAETWIKLVDSGEYEKSWEQAASFFKSRVPKEQWSQALKPSREALGAVIKRTVKIANFTETIPNMPTGEYVIVQFGTDFESKEGTTETVTLIKEQDDTWRVAGYFIS